MTGLLIVLGVAILGLIGSFYLENKLLKDKQK